MEAIQTAKEVIRKFITDSINLVQLEDDEKLFESGLVNSLFAIQLMTFLEQKFNIEVTVDDLSMENFESINSTAIFVEKKINSLTPNENR